ncbi:hypothetical protein LGK95_14055 [Clostridium algoriphilum]|uniref:hypothetical protein n=1 Tax=Clostridium algoriphilum TaxID=198347 RepID=UPI001CF2151A|nr:hypothetical protein [Clostridium algoriphilum]MCB2294622.1 hypothetical protein [Clostridium algoriphilum]
MKIMKGRELGNDEYEEFKEKLDRYVNIQGVDSKLVNIPTIVTGVNDDGTIRQEEIQPYAYEVVEQDERFTD